MDEPGEAALVAQVHGFVRTAVARGDRTFADVLEEAVEYVLDEHEDADAETVERICEAEIDKAFAAHLAAQATWPEITDCDRLDRAFEALNDGGIVARHDFSCCQNCGLAEIGEEIQGAIDAGFDVSGFAFYHTQDTDNAAEGHGLYLTYGHVDGGEDNSVAVGRVIVDALRKAGLDTEWDGTLRKRIGVRLDWRRRIPATAVVRLVSK
ncbi:hypothetical protein [Hyphomicrobium sp.]|uniref:DUF6891 domain-containing protein n=1 Tax=Hyphomicrobium sp. TaxID=82 RepID=UPI0025C26363|nr:hypothetical protein [Hyphomicrobium sp.]MCC7250802.1 hypothetical protein [Hyphomicrobium sp.]